MTCVLFLNVNLCSYYHQVPAQHKFIKHKPTYIGLFILLPTLYIITGTALLQSFLISSKMFSASQYIPP